MYVQQLLRKEKLAQPNKKKQKISIATQTSVYKESVIHSFFILSIDGYVPHKANIKLDDFLV